MVDLVVEPDGGEGERVALLSSTDLPVQQEEDCRRKRGV